MHACTYIEVSDLQTPLEHNTLTHNTHALFISFALAIIAVTLLLPLILIVNVIMLFWLL